MGLKGSPNASTLDSVFPMDCLFNFIERNILHILLFVHYDDNFGQFVKNQVKYWIKANGECKSHENQNITEQPY